MHRAAVGCFSLAFLFVAPLGWSQTTPADQHQTMFAIQGHRLADFMETHNNAQINELLPSEPPKFCPVIPAITMMLLAPDEPGKKLWDFNQMPLERKIAFEQAYTQVERKIRTCLGQAVQANDNEAIEVAVLAWSVLEARHLDLRASLLGETIVRIEQLSGAVEQMQKLVLAENQQQRESKEQRASHRQWLAVLAQGLGNWAQYQQQLTLYRQYEQEQAYAQQQGWSFQPPPAVDVFGMVMRAQEDIRNRIATPPPINCVTTTSLDGSLHTVCH